MAISPEEKRRFPRIEGHFPIRFQIRGSPEFDHTVSDNVSLGGLGLVNQRFIPPETLLMLEIKVLTSVLRPSVRVVWSAPFPHSDRYGMGVEFIGMKAEEEGYLADYIDMQCNK